MAAGQLLHRGGGRHRPGSACAWSGQAGVLALHRTEGKVLRMHGEWRATIPADWRGTCTGPKCAFLVTHACTAGPGTGMTRRACGAWVTLARVRMLTCVCARARTCLWRTWLLSSCVSTRRYGYAANLQQHSLDSPHSLRMHAHPPTPDPKPTPCPSP